MPFHQSFNKKNVVVTGHTGFKGSWLTTWLKELGAFVTGMSLEPNTKPSHFLAARLDQGIKDLRIDLRNRELVQKAIISAQPEFVFHLPLNLS